MASKKECISDYAFLELIGNNNFLKLGNIKIKDQRRLRAPEFYPANPGITRDSKLKMIISEAIQSGEVIVTESEVQEEWERLWNTINKKRQEKSFDQFNNIKKTFGALILFIIAFSILNLFVPKDNLSTINAQNPSVLYSERSKTNVISSNHEEDILTESHKVFINAERQFIQQSIIEFIH